MQIPIPVEAKAIIFDLDGTLIDSMPLHFDAYQYALEPWGVHYPKETFHARAGQPSVDTMELIREDFQIDNFSVEQAMRRKKEYVDDNLHTVKPISEMFDLMISQFGTIPMSIGTGSNKKMVNKIMDILDLRKYIPHIVTSDDVTQHKPAPDTFLKCATLMQVEPKHCVVYEDGMLGIEAAVSAGMMVVDVNDYL